MKASDFITVPEELLPAALSHAATMKTGGFSIKIEPNKIDYPRTPPFVARHGRTDVIVEIQAKVDLALLREWVRYAKGCQADTRVLVGFTANPRVKPADLDTLKSLGVGVAMIGGAGVYEVMPPTDLALNLELPELPMGLRRMLGGSYAQFNRGQWHDGFEQACVALEQQARMYLKAHLARGRITLAPTRTVTQIEKMPMGPLADAFASIQIPNAADTRIGQALARVNPDRITVAHYRGDARREKRLRQNVARHMFTIVGGLRQIKGISG